MGGGESVLGQDEPFKAMCVSVCGEDICDLIPPTLPPACDSGSPFLNPEGNGVYD